MKQGSFEMEIEIGRAPADVLALVSNYNRHTAIHPLIISVKQVESPPGVIGRYMITDRLRWGPFRFKTEYRADIVRVTDEEVHTEAHSSFGTSVNNLTRVTATAGGARLHETITVKAPELLFGYVFNQARDAHTEMLARIKQFMENNR